MGWGNTTETMGKTMSRMLPELSSFYMAEYWIYFNGGVLRTVNSGRQLIQVICKQDKRPFVTSTP
jgi:hypothetical protein